MEREGRGREEGKGEGGREGHHTPHLLLSQIPLMCSLTNHKLGQCLPSQIPPLSQGCHSTCTYGNGLVDDTFVPRVSLYMYIWQWTG